MPSTEPKVVDVKVETEEKDFGTLHIATVTTDEGVSRTRESFRKESAIQNAAEAAKSRSWW